PTEYGNYFSWGETSAKSSSSGNCATYGRNISDISGKTKYDAAYAKWGSTWRIPTLDEIDELISNCTTEWRSMDGVYGRKVTGPNGNSIFLPAAGCLIGMTLKSAGGYGEYWCSTSDNDNKSQYAYYLYISKNIVTSSWDNRNNGATVRPVSY
ncbi:MAG: hypothetical protein LUC44_07530, partial [Prevotellaceae bacterium]|nr:hypothetical protein [Prevotellaceae bacterium]